ncbi:hypothetical protein [Brevibacillus laterosporus]|uniref:hypothetical protein n=1 Tax=Brevibacillus laterosporus TaxID=1465 RepID=UPI0018CD5595|nr:hypothetical protein [Brevibacillus laterosporus]MBG9788725.1 hypothetical protein [Brevibacillus laterosporus]
MNTIMHEGKLYRKVSRKVKEGDEFIQITKAGEDLTSGRVYAIAGFDSYGDAEFYDDADDCRDSSTKEYVVLELVTDTAPITLISTTPAVEKTYTITLTDSVMEEIIAGLNRLPPHEIPDAVVSLEAIHQS